MLQANKGFFFLTFTKSHELYGLFNCYLVSSHVFLFRRRLAPVNSALQFNPLRSGGYYKYHLI
jgi:hypothetical protein